MLAQTEAIRPEVVSLYNGGLGAPDVARKLGIGSSTVYRLLVKSGISPSSLIAARKRNRIGKFTPEQDRDVADQYTNGRMSLAQLAAKYGCTLGPIRTALRREGVKIAPKGNKFFWFNKQDGEDIIRKYNSGASYESLCNTHGVHHNVIKNFLRNNGIEPRLGKRNYGERKYKMVRVSPNDPLFPMADKEGHALEHRIVMARCLGRVLSKKETVHHINGDTRDNRIENLQLRSGRHGAGQVCRCADCGSRNIVFEEM